jgi:RecA/RadA recombinase
MRPSLPPVSTAADLLAAARGAARRSVPTGCRRRDARCARAGGLPALGITELAGEAGSGKTQLCLQLAVHCVLPAELGGLGGLCVYLCAEDALPTARLEAMMRAIVGNRLRDAAASAAAAAAAAATAAAAFAAEAAADVTDDGATLPAPLPLPLPPPPPLLPPSEEAVAAHTRSMMGFVRVAQVADVAQLEARLGELERMLAQGRTRLVVLDSVAALHRDLLGQAGYDAPERSRGLTSLAALLKGFNHTFGVAVVVVNQVSDVVDEAASLAAAQACGPAAPMAAAGAEAAASSLARQLGAVFSNGRWMRPALGIVWSSCVTTRVMMTHPRFEPPGGAGGGFGGGGGGGGGVGGGGGAASRAPAPAAAAASSSFSASAAADLDLSDLDLEAWDRDAAAFAERQLQLQLQAQRPAAGARRGRQMYLLQSPELAPAVISFEVTAAGVEGVGEVASLACW